MNKTASDETSLKPAGGFANKNTQKDLGLGVTQYNSSIVHRNAKLNVEKASKKIDEKTLNIFNVFVNSS